MIKYENGKVLYCDKNGNEIKKGCNIKYPDGVIRKVYLTENGELGTDATNPLCIEDGRAVSCEFGIYVLEEYETDEVEVVD